MTERDAAYFVPLRLILLDRLKVFKESFGWNLRWFFWGQLWFNVRKDREAIEIIPFATAAYYPDDYEKAMAKETEDFPEWHTKAIESWKDWHDSP